MPPKRDVVAPHLSPLTLGHLEPGGTGDLLSGDDVEALEIEGVTVESLDLSGVTIRESRVVALAAGEAELRSARLLETRIERPNIPVLRGARGSWHDVVLEGGRLGASELYDSSWRSVHVVGCKLGYVNLRGAHLRDVLFTDCTIDELDLVQAKLDRVAFADTTVGRLDVRDATLTDVDLRGAELDGIDGVASLRGATIDGHQLVRLAPLLAREIGLRVE